MNPLPDTSPFSERLDVQVRPDLLSDSVAVFNSTGTHRYLLTRRWGAGDSLTVIMLNPSTADAFADDPTITRITRFARRDGYGGLVVLNLYGLRATDPVELARAGDPVGPDNDTMIAGCTWDTTRPVLVAWGGIAYQPRHRARVAAVVDDLTGRGVPLWCLGRTAAGHPRHPLYLPATAPLGPWWLPPGSSTTTVPEVTR
ncbi:DUF1643 domain-containing protein [Amycolatopsis sp. NPDC058340]|uniref:DUF1643 domain-containing protein n=1 Tax=Amycolatopsis sp. NPDC058340 TaxID=3346453 RepID=UPI003659B6C2